MSSLKQELELFCGRFTPEDEEETDYYYIPFEVPKGCSALLVEYDYSPCGEDCMIDVGLFQPGELGFLRAPSSFRGWSRSNKKTSRYMRIGPHRATCPGLCLREFGR